MRLTHYLWGLILLLIAVTTEAGTYQCSIPAAGEAVLDEAIATTHQGLTRTQIIQRMCIREVRTMFEQQTALTSRELDDKLKVASGASKLNARNALNAGISLPIVTNIGNQTNNVGQSPTMAIIATDPDELPLRVIATGLPPGMAVTSHVTTGDPEITGTLTAPGTFTVEVRAYKFSDLFGSDTFQWVINP